MIRTLVRRLLFRYGWDTRCRHHRAVQVLRRELDGLPSQDAPLVLDAGCGREGLAGFLHDTNVMGVDLERPHELLPNLTFTLGSITDLPFADRSFPLVGCIDVLQELSVDDRAKAVRELVRVARHGVLVASPQDGPAARADSDFARKLEARGAPVPPWVPASLSNPYPTVEAVLGVIREADPAAELSVWFSEPIGISRRVRAAAVRSSVLYAAVNLAFGLLVRAVPEPDQDTGYRMVVFARLARPSDMGGQEIRVPTS